MLHSICDLPWPGTELVSPALAGGFLTTKPRGMVTAATKLRRLLLGRKVMTKLDSIFKSRDITFPIKVCLVKAMAFPVVMYGCESWTVKKAAEELMLLNCGFGEDS